MSYIHGFLANSNKSHFHISPYNIPINKHFFGIYRISPLIRINTKKTSDYFNQIQKVGLKGPKR